MVNSLASSTRKQYDCYFKEWFNHCQLLKIDYLQASVPNIMFFMTKLYNSGYRYGSLNCCRSALSCILGQNITNDDRISRFMRGVFRSRPPQPKYEFTWDVDIVLRYLSQLYPNDSLNLELLSKKLITLLAIVTAHRVQTLSKIELKNIVFEPNCIYIMISSIIKTSRPNACQPLLKLPYFNERPEICPAQTLLCYKSKTDSLRICDDYLFISYRKPHAKVTSQRLSHWIKDMLHKSGVDTNVFSSHSTRHASTSKAKAAGINLDTIRRTAGWSTSSSVFARFYNRDVIPDNNYSYANSILQLK